MFAEGLEVLVLGMYQVDHLIYFLFPGQMRTHLHFLLLLQFLANVPILVLQFLKLLM